MKKFYILLLLATVGLFMKAQTAILNSQPIGSAGNLLSVDNSECNQLDANDSVNVVTFIHRIDNTLLMYSNVNIGEYGYDLSKDGGNTWTSNIGPITPNDSIDPNLNINGRYPQAVIYNRPGNTIADSALLIYSGTWHDEPGTAQTGSWQGELRGRGKLTGDTSTFNVHIDEVNGGQVLEATGLCRGIPGTFWNLNESTTFTFAPNSAQIINGLVVEKGVWNSVTRDVDWTNRLIPQAFDSNLFTYTDGSQALASVASGFNIAFDPSGKYGWIVCQGDIGADPDSVYRPIFWKTVDSGNTWTGPIIINLDSVPGIVEALNPVILTVSGITATLLPTTVSDDALTVDLYGNPHLLTTIGSGIEYVPEYTSYDVWDITFNAGSLNGCTWQGWSGIHLSQIWTYYGYLATSSSGDIGQDNRLLVSRNPDGSKLFFFWEDSDTTQVVNYANDAPNLFGRGLDVVAGKLTSTVNFTLNDSLWGAPTFASSGGIFGGAPFPVIGQTCLVHGNTYNIPLVLTEIDYDNPNTLGSGSADNPAQFFYINNINFHDADFTVNEGPAPVVTLNGSDTVTVMYNTSYTDSGATAYSCRYGSVPVDTQFVSPLNLAQEGYYYELYIATDSAGNSDTVTRVILVAGPPEAEFSWITLHLQVQFQDGSLYLPTSWNWNFGNGQTSQSQYPQPVNYDSTGSYDVCLTVSNFYGNSEICHQISVTAPSGISPVEEFSDQVSLFPNPSGGKVSITLNATSLPDFTVSTYDVLGQLVAGPSEYKSGTTNAQLDLSALSNGVYLVKIQSGIGTAVKNVVITHGSK